MSRLGTFALVALGFVATPWSAAAASEPASSAKALEPSVASDAAAAPLGPVGPKGDRRVWSARRWQVQGGANVDTEGMREGAGGAMRFSVRPGEGRPQDLGNGTERAELRDLSASPIGVEIRYAFSVKVGPGRPVPGVNGVFNEPWLIFAQLHTSDDMVGTFSPVWALALTPGDVFKVKIHGSDKEVHPPRGGMYESVLYQDPKFRRGRWYRFQVDQLYCPGGVSRLSVLMNGRLVVDYAGVLGFVGDKTPYFKTGIYRSPMNATDRVDIKDLSVRQLGEGGGSNCKGW